MTSDTIVKKLLKLRYTSISPTDKMQLLTAAGSSNLKMITTSHSDLALGSYSTNLLTGYYLKETPSRNDVDVHIRKGTTSYTLVPHPSHAVLFVVFKWHILYLSKVTLKARLIKSTAISLYKSSTFFS